VESQLKEITSEEVASLSDPRIKGLVTVTGVRVSPDFAHATVFYSVLAEACRARPAASRPR
jgi:ribosome-binding factor A